MSSSPQAWKRYRGDGQTPDGSAAATRGETGRYLADDDLITAVNTALVVQRPLLVTGEPGCGKTMLAWAVAAELGLGDVLSFHTRSDHQARDVLYTVDHLQRFYHAQIGDKSAADPVNGLDEYYRQGYNLMTSPAAQKEAKANVQSYFEIPLRIVGQPDVKVVATFGRSP